MVMFSNPLAPLTDTTNWLYAVVAYTAIYACLFVVNAGLVASKKTRSCLSFVPTSF